MFNVSIAIDNATVSAKVNELQDIWDLMVPALIARGFDLEHQIMWSLHEYVERSEKFLVTSQEDFDNILAGVKKDGFEEGYKQGNRDEYDRLTSLLPKDRKERYNAGFEDGVRYAKSGGESKSKDQSFCGND